MVPPPPAALPASLPDPHDARVHGEDRRGRLPEEAPPNAREGGGVLGEQEVNHGERKSICPKFFQSSKNAKFKFCTKIANFLLNVSTIVIS